MLPKRVARPVSTAIAGTEATTLGRLIGPAAAEHPGQSGFFLFNDGKGAIQTRVALAEVARSSIDAQYFEWAGDALGSVLLERVIAAAGRGVRVRLLIDDYNTKGHDLGFEALAAIPNIEVRVFNPYARGRLRLPQFIGRFTELNHRMHNKMFVVDGEAAIVGGRNLTDDYFGLGRALDFRDFDLLAIGAVVPQAEAAFDRYWNSEWAYPITTLKKRSSPEQLARARARFAAHLAEYRASFPYPLPGDGAAALAALEKSRGQAIWAPAEVVYDDPSLMARPLHDQPTAVGRKLMALASEARHEIVAENAYLIPHKELGLLRELRARGVRVQLLTNSLATTDVVAVNAAYAKSRPALTELGVALYEMKPHAASRALYVARATTSRAHLALHGKAAVFDRATVFLGSFNLDPRSMYLDSEAVFVVHSEELAAQLLDAFATDFDPANAWRIGRVVGKHKAAWISEWPGGADVEPHDPAGAWRRMMRAFAGILPLRKYL
ncbi:MAG: phospholipase D-like domain-containing protein, partial [Polyangia bacterium]